MEPDSVIEDKTIELMETKLLKDLVATEKESNMSVQQPAGTYRLYSCTPLL